MIDAHLRAYHMAHTKYNLEIGYGVVPLGVRFKFPLLKLNQITRKRSKLLES